MAEPGVKDGGQLLYSSLGHFRASRKISTVELQWIPNKNQTQKQYEFFSVPNLPAWFICPVPTAALIGRTIPGIRDEGLGMRGKG